jgi:hypothetical protein
MGGIILVGMTDPRRTAPQPAPVTEDTVDLVVPLMKASLEPASQQATRPIDSPAGRIVSQVARRDLAAGGVTRVLQLAAGVTSTLSYLVPALAQEMGHDPDRAGQALADALRNQDGNPYTIRILEQLHTPACIQVIGDAMAADHNHALDLVLDLADCAATHAQAYAHVSGTPMDEVWAEIQTGLHE